MGFRARRSARKARLSRKAEAKAIKRRAKLEARSTVKSNRKRARQDEKVARAQISALKAQEKLAAKEAAKQPFGAKDVKRYLGVAKLALPVLAPAAYKASTFVRGKLDDRRAERLGVDVMALGDYTGHGAKLLARSANAERSLNDILDAHSGDKETAEFGAATKARLADLTSALNAAEHMPASARRDAHRAINTELAAIESDLLARLGVS